MKHAVGSTSGQAKRPLLVLLLGLILICVLVAPASALAKPAPPPPAGEQLIAVVTTGEDSTAAVPAGGGGAAQPMAAAYTGKSVWVAIDYYSLLGSHICKFKVTKYWEYNYTRCNSINVTVAGTVDAEDALAGWDYKGVISSSGGYRSWGGSAYGAHYSYRQGKFVQTVLKVGVINTKYPQISITTYANGTWTYTSTP